METSEEIIRSCIKEQIASGKKIVASRWGIKQIDNYNFTSDRDNVCCPLGAVILSRHLEIPPPKKEPLTFNYLLEKILNQNFDWILCFTHGIDGYGPVWEPFIEEAYMLGANLRKELSLDRP